MNTKKNAKKNAIETCYEIEARQKFGAGKTPIGKDVRRFVAYANTDLARVKAYYADYCRALNEYDLRLIKTTREVIETM